MCNFLLLCIFRSLHSVYCLCVNVYCTAASGCQPNCVEIFVSFTYICMYVSYTNRWGTTSSEFTSRGRRNNLSKITGPFMRKRAYFALLLTEKSSGLCCTECPKIFLARYKPLILFNSKWICWSCITVYQYSDHASQYISIVTVHHSISVQCNQRDALFIQFVKN
jgi:hypothetical protein